MGRGPAPPEKAHKPKPKPRQEISILLKYLIFVFNFFFFLVGLAAVGLGSYLYSQDRRGVSSLADFLLNPALVLITIGLLISIISISGCMGALRENVTLLKAFSLAIFVCYILLVIGTFVIFLLFYSDSDAGISIRSLLDKALDNYSQNPNWRDFLDWVHQTLECCGASERGYKDWGDASHYNCSSSNHLPEACGVPYSCCHPESKALASSKHVQCWREAQQKSITELEQNRLVHTRGCLEPLQTAFESHAVVIGAVIGAIIIPVCVGVMLSNILGKQVEKQRYLLDREAKREEKRRRRFKHRFRDPFARSLTFNRRRNRSEDYHTVDETRELSPSATRTTPAPPLQELRATHLTQELILGQSSTPKADSPPKPAVKKPEPKPRRTDRVGKEGKVEGRSKSGGRARSRGEPPREEPPNHRLKIVELTDSE